MGVMQLPQSAWRLNRDKRRICMLCGDGFKVTSLLPFSATKWA
jgi:hypothetical protein